MFEANPFLGATRRTPRPTGTEPAYRSQTRRLLGRDQRLWDIAEQTRTATAGAVGSEYHADVVTRIRLEYLATASGTVAEWNRSHGQIIADVLGEETRRGQAANWVGSVLPTAHGVTG
jgi:hypothetical protein